MSAEHRLKTMALSFVVGALSCLVANGAQAETIKVGLLRFSSSGPLYIAQEKGYFASEGLTADFVYFDAAQPIALAVVSGDVDFGVGALTAGFYGLASQGAIRIIAGNHREEPSFRNQGFVVSSHAYDDGLKGYADLGGRSVAVSQIGSPPHYTLGLIAQKYHIDLKTIRVLALQSIPNNISAVTGGQADATFLPVTAVEPAIASGKMRVLGWVGDVVPWQVGAVVASAKTLTERGDVTKRFLNAFRRGTHDYHDAYADAEDRRTDEPTASDINAIIAKYVGVPPEQIGPSISFIDRDARIDVADIRRQVEWYQSQGMVKDQADSAQFIDMRYAVALP
jgi:NitT/TauT family transport system substrate-binding protein